LALGLISASIPGTLTGTPYQLEKYIKHTSPTGSYPVNSVFDDPGYDSYRDYVVSATCSGSAWVDDSGRTNVLWLAGSPIGAVWCHGQLALSADTVLIVLQNDHWRLHAFPVDSAQFGTAHCAQCGKPVFISY
jgi:hypothetical protein